jgi:hypothetical protein
MEPCGGWWRLETETETAGLGVACASCAASERNMSTARRASTWKRCATSVARSATTPGGGGGALTCATRHTLPGATDHPILPQAVRATQAAFCSGTRGSGAHVRR